MTRTLTRAKAQYPAWRCGSAAQRIVLSRGLACKLRRQRERDRSTSVSTDERSRTSNQHDRRACKEEDKDVAVLIVQLLRNVGQSAFPTDAVAQHSRTSCWPCRWRAWQMFVAVPLPAEVCVGRHNGSQQEHSCHYDNAEGHNSEQQ